MMGMRRGSAVEMAAAKEDRLQRALQENHQLKNQLNKQGEKLKLVQVQFQKLTGDLRRLGPGAVPRPAELPALPQVEQMRRDFAALSAERDKLVVERDMIAAERDRITAERDRITAERDRIASDRDRITAERDRIASDRDRMALDRDERALVRAVSARDFARHSFGVLSAPPDAAVEALTRERDALSLRLRLAEAKAMEAMKAMEAPPGADPAALAALQCDAREKARQLAVLTSRMNQAQQQAESLQNECARLVEELRRFHAMQAETKRQLFDAEHARGLLQVRCARVDELEAAVQRKSEALVHAEEELLRTAAALQSCSRETEEAVRREFATRVADLQEMCDAAEARRREKEARLLDAQREAAELRRQLEVARGDKEMYREQLDKCRADVERAAGAVVAAGHTAAELSDEDVRRAVAIAAMRRRARGTGTAGDRAHRAWDKDKDKDKDKDRNTDRERDEDDAAEALEMWDALQWDEAWEAEQLREALASAALDMELANQRAAQLSEQAEKSRALLQQLTSERDALLDENIEMRQGLTRVQTVFAKQQLDAYRAAKERGRLGPGNGPSDAVDSGGGIFFCVRDVEGSDALLRASGAFDASSPIALFFTLDGLRTHDTMVSPTFYSLNEPLDIRFRYDRLDCDEITADEVRRTTFVLQLHRARGAASAVVAMAEVPGAALLSRRGAHTVERVALFTGTGEAAGAALVEMAAEGLMLPVRVGIPPTGAAQSAEERRAAVLALRSVVALRVQVFRADGLLAEPVPQPYVFYAASCAAGSACVRDTVVKTSTKAFTRDPVFDADPVDHRIVVDGDVVQFLAEGSVVFVVFDERAKDAQANLGVAEVPLRPLLASPQALIRTTEKLHPQGTLSIGLSWVTRT